MCPRKSPLPQVMPNTILTVCGPHLVAFCWQEFCWELRKWLLYLQPGVLRANHETEYLTQSILCCASDIFDTEILSGGEGLNPKIFVEGELQRPPPPPLLRSPCRWLGFFFTVYIDNRWQERKLSQTPLYHIISGSENKVKDNHAYCSNSFSWSLVTLVWVMSSPNCSLLCGQ